MVADIMGLEYSDTPPNTSMCKNLITLAGPRLKSCGLFHPPSTYGYAFGGISPAWVYCFQLALSPLPALRKQLDLLHRSAEKQSFVHSHLGIIGQRQPRGHRAFFCREVGGF